MVQYTFQKIKEFLLKSINEDQCEAELTLIFEDKPCEYMIIIYKGCCSFQRCSGHGIAGSGEYIYDTLDELYKAQQIDGIILERDWGKIKEFDCFDFLSMGYWK